MIYYDITDLMEYFRKNAQTSGVQRVTLAAIVFFQKIRANAEIRLLAFHPRLGRLVSADISALRADISEGPVLAASLGVRYRGPHPLDDYLRQQYGSSAKRLLHKCRLSLSNMITGGRTFRRKCIGTPNSAGQVRKVTWEPVELSDRDIVMISGGPLVRGPLLRTLAAARSRTGVRLVFFIHDVLPISFPQFFLQGHPLAFSDWILTVAAQADHFITSTKANRAALVAELARRERGVPPVDVVPLAHEFLSRKHEEHRPVYELVSAPVLAAARMPFALCVGTREIRKNNLLLAQVWHDLEAKRGHALPCLLFAGREGWMNDDFNQFLARTGNVNGKVRLINAPSEQELAYLYKTCLFSVYPSLAEGWGLPIGESLWFGRPVIASSVTGMPEVAGDFVDYVDPYDFNSLKGAVERMLDAEYRKQRTDKVGLMPLRLWDDYASDLFGTLRRIEAANRTAAPM